MTTPYQQPDYLLTLGGLDITPRVGSRLISLQLDESRGDEADQLELCLDDADYQRFVFGLTPETSLAACAA